MAVFNFTPSALAAFQFQPTLDGNVYSCRVPWNLFRQGYYLEIYTLAGVLVGSMPFIGSPNDYPISLSEPFGFASTLVYYESAGQIVVTP